MPLSILEAQATKVPVLAAPTSGIPEIVTDGETGFLIAPADPDCYAERLKLLLSDPDLACGMARGAYSKITSEHTSEIYFERIRSLYQDRLNLH